MPVNTKAIGKTYEPVALRGRPREDPRVRARRRRDRPRAPRRRGRSRGRLRGPASRRRCSRSSTARPAVGPPIFDPEIELNFAMMVHGGQEFVWGAPVVAGDEITTTASRQGHLRKRRPRLLRVRVGLHQPARRAGLPRHLDQHRPRSVSAMAELQAGRADPRAAGDARQVPDGPLRGRVGRLQPDPHRRGVRARGGAARDGSCTASGRWPRSRARRPRPPAAPSTSSGCRCSSAAWACPSRRSLVTGHRARGRATARAIVDTVAEQAGNQIIRNAEAELEALSAGAAPARRRQRRRLQSGRCSPPARSGSCARSSRTTCTPASRSPRA